MRYFYNLFNRPLRYDLHRNQDEEFQKKNHPHGVVDLRRRNHEPNQEEDSLEKNRTIEVVPNQTAIQSNQNLVADEEESRNYEKDISGTQSASFKNTSYIVKVLEDRFHENDLIGSQSARCNMTCDKGNLSEREEDSTKTTFYKKGSPTRHRSPVERGDQKDECEEASTKRSKKKKCEEAMFCDTNSS